MEAPRTDAVAGAEYGVVSAAGALAAGMTRSMVDWRRDSGLWRPLLAGTYLVGADGYPAEWAALDFSTRLVAARLAHGPEAVAVLSTAATVLDLPGRPPDDGIIHLRLPPGRERHQQPGVSLHTWKVRDEEATMVQGIPVTTRLRTLADLARTRSRFEAVSALDAALNAGLVLGPELESIEFHLAGLRGAVAARRRVKEANGLAQSPLETRVRLIASDAGLAPDHLQYPVRDRRGVLLGYGDMAWDRVGRRTLVAEADGASIHGRPEALYRDRLRANDFVGTDEVDMVRFTWQDTVRPAYLVAVLRRNLRPR